MKKTSLYFAALAAVAVSAPLSAQTVSWEAGTVSTTAGPIQSAVRVYEMTGLKLTAFWADNSFQSYTLGQIAGSTYGFTGTDLQLGLHGWSDTYYGAWSLDNRRGSNLNRLLFETTGTRVMFDRSTGYLGMSEGTPGSSVGYDFNSGTCTFLGYVLCDIGGHVTYRDAVALSPNGPVFDVFRTMDVSLGRGIGSRSTHDLFMRFDTDLTTTDYLEPAVVPTDVPEPATFALMAFGIVGLGAAARRRQRNA